MTFRPASLAGALAPALLALCATTGMAPADAQAPATPAAPASAAAPAQAAAGPLRLHVPSPDWRDQVIYFVMTDRFDDGDPTNNDLGAGEYDPRSNAHYNGGDFAGLQRRLDYVAGLGATAVWITPPVSSLWWDASANYGGYHGYWAEHFMRVDRHLGTLDDYKALSHALHSRGMYLVQDIVLNHTGNFFGYAPGSWRAGDPARGFAPNTGARPVTAPTQPPFDLNDARNPAHRAAGIYHWTPDITDFKNPRQLLDWQLAGLDDLNTDHPRVRRALRESYGFWLREVGVDAFRVDTAFYVPPSLFTDFLHSPDPAAPGIERVARATGRTGFYSFGEGFATDAPFATSQLRRIERYVRDPQGRPLMTGMLNFTLYGSLGDVLARGAPTAVLGHRIDAMMRLHSDPHRLATFVDNHDVDRFLAGGSEAGLRQALLAIMTLPGVPVLYYGTEQGFTEQRGAMFAAGFGSGGRDRFDTAHPLYQTIARLTQLRREHRLFSRGVPTVLQTSTTGPGVIAWRMQHGADAALVVLNTADSPRLLHGLPTGLPAGTALQPLLALDGTPAALRAGAGGLLTAELPARSGQVWRLAGDGSPAGMPARAASTQLRPALAAAPLAITRLRPSADGNALQADGRAPAGSRLQLLADGDLAAATAVQADATGRWQARLDVSRLRAGVDHQLVAWQAAATPTDGGKVSAPRPFRLQRQWTLLADQADPAGDDRGPGGAAGTYTYPTDASWAGAGHMDLRRARVWRSGTSLKIELTTGQLARVWGAPNGFDHVVFTLFFSRPGAEGASVMPQQQASLPDGGRWQHRLRVGGWGNAFYSATGADATSEGTPVTPAAEIEADRARRTVTLTLPAGSLGPAETLAGLRIHVTTWDHDGGYRSLGPQAGGHTVGGADPTGPKVMDAMTVVLP